MRSDPSETCEITLPGGSCDYHFRVPARNMGEILAPARMAANQPVASLVRRALSEPVGCLPLSQLVRPAASVLIVVDDITRGTPAAAVIPEVLACLAGAGCRREDITFALALGTHRPMTQPEIEQKLGTEVARHFPVINTPAQQSDAFVDTGETWDGVPIEVHRAVLAAGLVLGIGSVVPHADAGWSGGCKIILPGMCSERTVMENHFMATRHALNLLGQEETPIRQNMEGIVAKIGLDYVLNLVMTPYGEVIDVLGGHFVAAQRAAIRAARPIYSIPFQERADVVVSNAYPAEIDLWQASKGIWAGELLVKRGGRLIVNGPCPEGIGPHPDYLRLMQSDTGDVLAAVEAGQVVDKNVVGSAVPVTRMLKYLHLTLVSPGLQAAAFGDGPIRHSPDLQQAVDENLAAAGPDARLSVITHGGYAYPVQS